MFYPANITHSLDYSIYLQYIIISRGRYRDVGSSIVAIMQNPERLMNVVTLFCSARTLATAALAASIADDGSEDESSARGSGTSHDEIAYSIEMDNNIIPAHMAIAPNI